MVYKSINRVKSVGHSFICFIYQCLLPLIYPFCWTISFFSMSLFINSNSLSLNSFIRAKTAQRIFSFLCVLTLLWFWVIDWLWLWLVFKFSLFFCPRPLFWTDWLCTLWPPVLNWFYWLFLASWADWEFYYLLFWIFWIL